MSMIRLVLIGSIVMAPVGAGLAAQAGPPLKEAVAVQPISLSGPRFGLTLLSSGIRGGVVEFTGDNIAPVVTQFGWQWEKRFFTLDGGPTGVSEWVLLVGGLEQSVFLPSLTWLVGIRSTRGAEIGIGPNVTPAGAALALAGGVTLQSGPIFFPINLAVVPSRSGIRVSLLTGFNMRRGTAASAAAVP